MLTAARAAVLGDLKLVALLYWAALTGRVLYALHRASGHSVVWKASRSASPLCSGDIVCESCARVLWRRAHDPWRPIASRRGPLLDDHWGDTAEDNARHGRSLFEALDRVLGLAERLPSGASSAQIRRSACELIEASSAAERHVRFRRLVNLIDALRPADAGPRIDPDARAAVIEQLLTALRHEVAPILLSRRQH
jgi:hypothetical protein